MNGAVAGGASLSFPCLSVRGGVVCSWSVQGCHSQVVLSCSARLEPPSCLGIIGKGQHVNTERSLRVPVGRRVDFYQPLDTDKLHNPNCYFMQTEIGKTHRLIHRCLLRISERQHVICSCRNCWGLCGRLPLAPFLHASCVFLTQCLSEFANLTSANLYLGSGIPHSVLGYPFPTQR